MKNFYHIIILSLLSYLIGVEPIDENNASNIWITDESPIIKSSIIWQGIDSEMWEGWGVAWHQGFWVEYSNLSQEIVSGEGNIYADPQFTDSENGDYYRLLTSY